MGRGKLTSKEIAVLSENPYVEDVNENRIVYTEEFKHLFIEEYFSGKKPSCIFEDAGFDLKILGSKRIERASARWREANASGNLGEIHVNNDFYNKTENELGRLRRIINEKEAEIERLEKEIRKLNKKLNEMKF